MRLHTAATLPISEAALVNEIARNRFTLYDHQHLGDALYVFDDGDTELLGYTQWTTWERHVEIDAIESARRGCGRVLVGWLKYRFDRLVTTSRQNDGTLAFWRSMGFAQDRDDPYALFWVRR